MTDENLIFHYTSSDGLMGILCNGYIRMTNVKYLNDSKELIHGIDLAKKYLSDAIEELKTSSRHKHRIEGLTLQPLGGLLGGLSSLNNEPPEPDFPREYRFSEIVFGQLNSWLDEMKFFAPFYTASFCKKGNALRQWMAYCPAGGYAIGVNHEELKEYLKEIKHLDLRPVDYHGKTKLLKKRNEQIKKIALEYSALLDPLFEKYEDSNELFESQEYETGRDRLSNRIKDQAYLIARASLTQKEKPFFDEEEVRLIQPNLTSMHSLVEDYSNIDFYTKNSLLIPYIAFDIPKEMISKIYVGPMQNQELACYSLSKLKAKHNFKFKIERSKIPLRAI